MNEEIFNPNAVDFIGSSGTLIAAALETIGYYYQSILMDALSFSAAGRPTAFVALGALFYSVGVVVALISVLAFGKYKFSAWLLIGPTLFYACVMSRIETSGSAWLFGSQKKSSALLRAKVEDNLGREDRQYKPRVSAVFAWYNKLVSSTVNGIVDVINGNKDDVDTSFFVRTQMYQALGGSAIENPGLQVLIHQSFFGECRKQLEYGKKMRDKRQSPESRQWFLERYSALSRERQVQPKGPALEYIKQVHAFYPALFKEVIVATAAEEVNKAKKGEDTYVVRLDTGSQGLVFSTAEENIVNTLDGMNKRAGSAGFKEFFEEEMKTIEGTTGLANDVARVRSEVSEADKLLPTKERDGTERDPEEIFDYTRSPELRKTYDILKANNPNTPHTLFTADVGGLSSVSPASFTKQSYSCHEIWQLVYASLHWQGLIKLREQLHQGVEVGAKAGQQMRFLHDMMVATRHYQNRLTQAKTAREVDNVGELEDALVNAIAKRIFRNELERGSLSSKIASLLANVKRADHVSVDADSGLAQREAERLSNTTWAEKVKAMSAVQTMPYYQGVILYFLAVTFPFFAFLLVIPGKHPGFFLWFILWFWAKSWDIGWAIVMMLDDVMHAVFVQGFQETGVQTGLERELSLASLALEAHDPTFHPAIYYTVMAIAFKAIPFVTSYLVVGSLKGSGSMIAEGMNRYSSSDNAFGRMSGLGGVGRAVVEGGGLWNVKTESNDRVMAGVQNALDRDMGGKAGTDGMGSSHRAASMNVRPEGDYFDGHYFAGGGKFGVNKQSGQYVGDRFKEGIGQGLASGGKIPNDVSVKSLVSVGAGAIAGPAPQRGPRGAGGGAGTGSGIPRTILSPEAKARQKIRGANKFFSNKKFKVGAGPVTGVVNSIGEGMQAYYAMRTETGMRALKARVNLVTAWAAHDISGDARSAKLAEDLIVFGCIPIFTADKVNHTVTSEHVQMVFNNDAQFREAVAGVAVAAGKGAINLKENLK